MQAQTGITDPADHLAAMLDVLSAGCVNGDETTMAWLPATDAGRADESTRSDVRLGPPPDHAVAAVAVAATGTAHRIGGDSTKRLVRVTVAVSCCRTSALMRHPDGRVERSMGIDGAVPLILRRWAVLEPCAMCA